MRCIGWAFILLLAAACTGSTEDDGREQSASTASSPHATSAPQKTAAAKPAQPQPASYTLAIERIDVAKAEDGAGNTIAATDARALLVRAAEWPGRALDPVLYVGQLHFHQYDYPSKGVLRYVVADAALLAPGVEVALQYGDDTHSRVVISPALDPEVQP